MRYALLALPLLVLTACADTDPAGPTVSLTCSQDQTNDNNVNNITATNNCDKSTRTADPFVIEPVIVETE